MRLTTKLVSVFTALAAASSLYAAEYNLDASHSHVSFKIKHLMISNVSGDFGDYSAVIDFDPKTKTLNKLEGTVMVASIDTAIEKRDDHLKSDDFFSADKFPKMTFKMKKIKGDKLIGDLTIRDVTKEVAFDYELGGVATDPWGNERMGFELSGKINRMDYGLKWNKALEAGGFVVGEEVKLSIGIEAIKK